MAWIVESSAGDVFGNLAVEEYLFDRAAEFAPALFLCRNERAVVIGKNQNPWRECRVERLEAEGAALARRVSGGGAVYHDRGNLNYGLILRRTEYRSEDAFALVVAALARLGFAARLTGRTRLTVNGFKVSGTAFALRGGGALHHGTLLVRSDLEPMPRLFPGGLAVFETHAVASEPMPVANLADFAPTLTPGDAAAALRDEFERRYGAARRAGDAEIRRWDWQDLRNRRSAPAWVFGRTPSFVTGHPDGPRLRVEDGMVREVAGPAPAGWIGTPFAEIYRDWISVVSAGASST